MTDAWELVAVPKLGAALKPGLGQVRVGREFQPIPRWSPADLSATAHARCVDHVKMPGLARPVCVGRGDDREAILADAVALSGGDRR